MTVHVLMPVHNRCAMTRTMLECLRAQQADEPLSLVVIDDGSSDGTREFLSAQLDVTVLQGDGSLWWGGAIDLGLRHVLARASADDWVLFVNNDTRIESGFLQALLGVARLHPPAAVGSVIRDMHAPHRVLSVGPRIDPQRFLVADILDTEPQLQAASHGAHPVDALSGRGVLYPVAALRTVQGMRPRWLPHYLADYELALRVQSAGWQLMVCLAAAVYSSDDYGNVFKSSTLYERLFSARSPAYLPARIRFWWAASNCYQKLSLPWRLVAFKLFPRLRRKA